MLEPTQFLELGAVGALGAAFIIVMRWMLGQMTAEFRHIATVLTANAMILNDMHRTLIVHDAQIRGVHPAAGEDANERCQKAAEEYQKLQAGVESTAAKLEILANSQHPRG